jgi:hypothetical protein
MTAVAHRQTTNVSSGGTSEFAVFIDEQIEQSRSQLKRSYSFGWQIKVAFNELYQVYEECHEANWDGYGAVPVSESVFLDAFNFLKALPLGTPAPSIGAEPDGHITLEWYSSPRQTLSISVSPNGELHYAAIMGASKTYGTEPFYGEVPQVIIDIIHRVVST